MAPLAGNSPERRTIFAIESGLMPHVKELPGVKRVYLIGICGTASVSG